MVVDGMGVTNSTIIQPMTDGTSSSRGRYEEDTTLDQLIYVMPSESQRPRLVCQTIIQDAEVLNVGMFSLTAPTTGNNTTATPAVAATKMLMPRRAESIRVQ